MDRRIARTQKALIEALQTCLSQHPWEDISVQMICDTADISRSTFYAHFDDKQALLSMGMEKVSSHLVADDDGSRGLDLNGTLRILPALLRHMRGSLSLFDNTRSSLPGRELTAQFEQTIGKIIRDEVVQSRFRNTITSDQLTFLQGGLFAMLDAWRIDRCAASDEDILGRLDHLAGQILR